MTELTAGQIRSLADSLITTQEELTNFLVKNRTRLSPEEKEKINEAADKLADEASGLVAQAIQGTAHELRNSVQGIRDATNNAKMALRTLNNIKKVLNIVKKLLGLAAAIATGRPDQIIPAVTGVIKEVNLSNII